MGRVSVLRKTGVPIAAPVNSWNAFQGLKWDSAEVGSRQCRQLGKWCGGYVIWRYGDMPLWLKINRQPRPSAPLSTFAPTAFLSFFFESFDAKFDV